MSLSIQQLQQHYPTQAPQKTSMKSTVNFKDILTEFQGIKVSKHAKQRLDERNIQINDKQWQTISKTY